MSLSVELDGSPAAAVATLESAALFFLKGRRDANPDQPFVDFRPISAELGVDYDTTRAILRRLKERGAILTKWDFGGGDIGIILEGGGYAAKEEGAA